MLRSILDSRGGVAGDGRHGRVSPLASAAWAIAAEVLRRTVAGEELPAEYKILPHEIALRIPGFEAWDLPWSKTLALSPAPCEEQFERFLQRIEGAIGREHLPVCRMSDGEYRFLLGDQPPDIRLPLSLRLRTQVGRLRAGRTFSASTRPDVSSGEYSAEEWRSSRRRYTELLRTMAGDGILALHLSYGRVPFQEHYFPALRRWLDESGISLTRENCHPFYFVYAALTGPAAERLIRGRRVLLVNSSTGAKRGAIEAAMERQGAKAIRWIGTSARRSLYDRIDTEGLCREVDIAFVGAGVGKPNVLNQLRPLRVPCLDAGFVFEVWADPRAAKDRSYCSPRGP